MILARTCIVMDAFVLIAVALWTLFDADPALVLQANLAQGIAHVLAGVAALAGAPASKALRRASDWATATTSLSRPS